MANIEVTEVDRKLFLQETLFSAVVDCKIKMIKHLLSLGADVNYIYDESNHEETIMEVACCDDVKLYLVKLLVKHGADVKINDNEPICCACSSKNLYIVVYLVSKGADVRCQNNQPIKNAFDSGSMDIVQFLIDHGADPTVYTLNDAACSNSVDTLKYVINMRKYTSDELTFVIDLAIISRHIKTVPFLLSYGVEFTNDAAKEACSCSNLKLGELLIANRPSAATVLSLNNFSLAIRQGSAIIVSAMLDHGFTISYEDLVKYKIKHVEVLDVLNMYLRRVYQNK
jgi:ankyrin repeat protein